MFKWNPTSNQKRRSWKLSFCVLRIISVSAESLTGRDAAINENLPCKNRDRASNYILLNLNNGKH